MSEWFCSVIERGIDRRMTIPVQAQVDEQAVELAKEEYERHWPRKIGEIRKYDIIVMRRPKCQA